jgi:tRNA pseudouridine synthase 10
VEVQLNPLFFRGRYLKFVRGIPQTHWDCRKCRGEGCEECNFIGKQYLESVEELIGKAVVKAFDAENVILHGSGREDIDARMLGTGRPFVMEAMNPRKRHYDLDKLEDEINSVADGKVAVRDLSWCTRRDVERVKSNKAYKKYRILVDIDTLSAVNDLESAINSLKGREINQRTPVRVSHRRADKVRKRRVLDISLIGVEDGKYLIEVLGDAGLYIKELISGDKERTTPSLSELLGTKAEVVTLDVIEVIEDENNDNATGQT